jgi:signal transduction histidine kinase
MAAPDQPVRENTASDPRAIAQELQDNVEQLLTAAVIELGIIARDAGAPELVEQIEHTRAACRQALEQTRALMSELDPPVLHDLGLAAALDWLVEHHGQLGGIEIAFEDASAGRAADPAAAEALFQGARAALRNLTRQARASRARVRLTVEAETWSVDIRDDVGTQAMLFAPLEPELPSRHPTDEPQLEER